MSQTPSSQDPTTGRVSRRTVARGAAWTLPVVVVSSAAPALSASPALRTVTTTITADRNTARTGSVTIPANARNITYEVVGGGGATAFGYQYSGPGGSGARITGSLALTCGQPVTLWMVAGGGGIGSSSTPTTATGFGNGGPSTPIPPPPDAWIFPNSAQGWAAGGGAGSAIAIGGAPDAGGTLVVAAGGGGAHGVSTHSRMASTTAPHNRGLTGGVGGSAGGGSATALVVTQPGGTITAAGGRGATGPTGGAASGSSSTGVTGYFLLDQKAGNAGGAKGTGAYGGGNGAPPVEVWSRNGVDDMRIGSGSGGGGYAGGGSGGAINVGAERLVTGGADLIHYRAIAGVGGAGGAGSNFVGSTFPCLTNLGATQGQAGNGGTQTSSSTVNGGPGRVTVTYQVPA